MGTVKTPQITAIIPVRLSADRLYDEPERINRIIETLPPQYDVLIVDYGTLPERAAELEVISRTTGCKLVRVETGDRPFSVGHARDIGAQHASAPLVIFHDIDFLLSRESYLRILKEAKLKGMPENAYTWFAIPGAYLTEDFTSTYIELHQSGDGEFADMIVHDGIVRKDNSIYTHNTYAISSIVCNRFHLLALGGHDKSFVGHGAEDFELMHRLTSYYMRGPRTRKYYTNTKNNDIKDYEGFRAFFALYGIDIFQRGLVISHLWHPRRVGNGYTGRDNQVRVSQVMRDYDCGRQHLPPLEDLTSNEHTLALVTPGSAPWKALRHAFPAMGRFKCIPEKSFQTAESLVDFATTEGFTRILFLNPYGNQHRLELYRTAKQSGLRIVTYDRGALNASWFFDQGGFLAESTSYDPLVWNKPISAGEKEETGKFLFDMRLSNETLERNGAPVGADSLRQKLEIGDREVLFVALQRPSDTATIYFGGACDGADGFNKWIAYLAENVDPRRYVVVAKKHPLEATRPEIQNVKFTDDDTHINDLIEVAQKVIVINSGTGLLAIAYGKPVICCGQAFYAHEGLARAAASKEELLRIAQSEIAVDNEARLRFLTYLISDFYSFGPSEYREVPQQDGSVRSMAQKVVYSDIRGLRKEPIKLGKIPPGVSLDAPLFFSFGGRSGVKTSSTNAVRTDGRTDKRLNSLIARPFVSRLGTKNDVDKFNADPAGFFAGLSNPWYRIIGRVLFPPGRRQHTE